MDPACGWGSLLLSAALVAKANGQSAEFVGIDTANLALTGAWARFESRGIRFEATCADAFTLGILDDRIEQADLVLVDAPTGRAERPEFVPRMTHFGRPPSEEQGFLWLDLAYQLLRPGGRAVVITHQRTVSDFMVDGGQKPNGASKLSQQGRFLQGLRESGVVVGIVRLPKGYRAGRSASVAVWVLRKPYPDLTGASNIAAASWEPLVVDGAKEVAAAGDRSKGIASVASRISARMDEVETARGTATVLEQPIEGGTQGQPAVSPTDTPADGRVFRIELTADARVSRRHLLTEVESMKDFLTRVRATLTSELPALPDFNLLSELEREGSVACYLVVQPASGLMLSGRNMGGDVMLNPIPPLSMRPSSGTYDDEDADQVPLQPNDVIVTVDESGRVNARVAKTSEYNEIPEDAWERGNLKYRVTVMRPVARVQPEDLVLAVLSLERRGWPNDSRGPLSPLAARDEIGVNYAPQLDPGGLPWMEVRELVLKLPERLNDLANEISDPHNLLRMNEIRRLPGSTGPAG